MVCEGKLDRGDAARGVTCGEARGDAECPLGEVASGHMLTLAP